MTKLGLVLAGGGGKGSYEIGVWKFLQKGHTGFRWDIMIVKISMPFELKDYPNQWREY